MKMAIVVSQFNRPITSALLERCKECLAEAGVETEVVHVPGAFEIPLIANRLAASKRFAAVITLGCVIKGATPHFDYICREVARAIMDCSIQQDIPIIFGILTAENRAQAEERAAREGKNRGREFALTALEMAKL